MYDCEKVCWLLPFGKEPPRLIPDLMFCWFHFVDYEMEKQRRTSLVVFGRCMQWVHANVVQYYIPCAQKYGGEILGGMWRNMFSHKYLLSAVSAKGKEKKNMSLSGR